MFAGVLCEASFGDLAQNILDLKCIGSPGPSSNFPILSFVVPPRWPCIIGRCSEPCDGSDELLRNRS